MDSFLAGIEKPTTTLTLPSSVGGKYKKRGGMKHQSGGSCSECGI